jgi:hypothetical protein
MKIEIDLNDILGDEYGAETLNDSIRRQVVDALSKTVERGIANKINEEIDSQINTAIKDFLDVNLPALFADMLEAEYQPVNRWGGKDGGPTTLRNQLIKSVTEQMVYKKQRYDSDNNTFTKSVDSIVNDQMKIIEKNYREIVDESIAKKAFELAIDTLKKKLGL